jgi:tetratricopeptide (TPR) repeat protein
VPDNPRIEELRRRVQKDPASIAFAQLAEEHRRLGDYAEAARVCRAGLDRHPTYLSARVTLGRALIELGQYDQAEAELQYVLRSAPENLAAVRGLGEIHQRRGNLPEALRQFQIALALARHDPELEESVHDLTRQLQTDSHASEARPSGPRSAAIPVGSLSPELEAAADEFTKALQALDALSLDLPAAPPAADAEDDTVSEDNEPELEAPAEAPVAQLAGDEAVVHELESWLDSIVRDREHRGAQGDRRGQGDNIGLLRK